MIQRKSIHLLPILLLTFSAACKNKQEAANAPSEPPPSVVIDQSGPRFGGIEEADSLFFALERTPCFGACQAYRIKVYRSGFATYDGRVRMEKMGMHTGKVTPEMMEDLLTKAEGYGYFNMNEKYDAQVTDLPSTIIQINSNGRMRKVLARVGTPATFKSLAEYAEGQLLPLKWKAVETKQ